MQDLFSSGRIVDIIIGLMVLEALFLIAYYSATGKGVRPPQALAALAAGASLFVALRLALTDAPWIWIGVALMASLAAHVADLTSRWNRA